MGNNDMNIEDFGRIVASEMNLKMMIEKNEIYESNEDIILDILENLKKIRTNELDFESKLELFNAKDSLTNILNYIDLLNDY